MKRITFAIFIFFVVVCVLPCEISGAQEPAGKLVPDGLLHDNAKILTEKEYADISAVLKNHNDKGLGKISIITLSKLPEDVSIEMYGDELMKAYDLANTNSECVLIIVSIGDRKIRIQTSDAIAEKLTEGECAYTVNHLIVPDFKQQRYYEGIKAGLGSIIAALER